MKKLLFALTALICLSFSGCFRFYVAAREYKPVLPTPVAPELTENAPFDNPDFTALVEYSMKLEAVIDSYNKSAHANNVANGFEEIQGK